MVQREKGVSVGHRGRFDIIADILNACSQGAKKTQIMYRCNLSFKQLAIYVGLLTAKKLLSGKLDGENGEPAIYATTDKGHSFLRIYHTLNALLTT